MRIKLLVVFLLIGFLVAGCASQATPTQEPTAQPTEPQAVVPTTEPAAASTGDTIKIGFFGPLTGPTSLAGIALMQGAEMKFDEINASGGVLGHPIEFVTCDDKSTPEEAVKCVQKLINQDHVLEIVGSLHSPHLMATGPILDEFKVPTVAAGTSPTWCQQGFQYLWRALANSTQATLAVGNALKDSGLKKLAILYQNDDYGISGKDSLKSSLSYMDTVDEEAYNLGDKDWSGQIIKMIAAQPDVMAVWGLGDDLGPQLNQIRDLGWTGPIITAEGCTYPDVIKVAGANANGAMCGALYYVPEKPEDMANPLIRDFLVKYQSKYGEMPASDNAYRGYDSVSVLVDGIQQANSLDPEKIKDAINSISNLEGLAGTFDYAKGGCEGIQTSRVWEFKDQKLVPFEGLK
jgi:branched-chain amino acid transport system substrate-binding protein